MRDKPCQKGNQPCCYNASLLNHLHFFLQYMLTQTHTPTQILMTLFNTCIFSRGLTQCPGVDVACLTLHFSTSKPISQYCLPLPVIKDDEARAQSPLTHEAP